MGPLAWISLSLGAVMLVGYGYMCLKPDAALAWWRKFPRSVPAAWVLTTVALVWSGYLLCQTPLGPVESYKPALFALVPVAIVMLVRFVDELLAVRALGGLMILIPAPILEVARWHDSSWRLAIVVFCYMMVVKGAMFVLAPYMFRKGMEWGEQHFKNIRVVLSIGVVMGAAFIVLALTAYRVS